MKILVIMKRFGAGQDMVSREFGRQISLFKPLVQDHKIDFFCPDTVKHENFTAKKNGIRYIVRPFRWWSFYSLWNEMKKIVRQGQYDAIVGTTDPIYGIMANCLSRKYGVPFVYDLQDNFEIYDAYKFPLVGHYDRKAVREADGLITVSRELKRHISQFRKGRIGVVPNGVDLGMFRKIDQRMARKKLGLAKKTGNNGKIVTYVGEISSLKGANVLLDAFDILLRKHPNTYLLLSGQVKNNIDIERENVIFEALPKREEVVLAINASDAVVIPNLENEFSRYCFPYKLPEYMACSVNIVATKIGDIALMLEDYGDSLAKPGDAKDLADKLAKALGKKDRPDYSAHLKELKWESLSKQTEKIIEEAVGSGKRQPPSKA
ncbi:glycosyltransferase family 4 protein [Candidatus Woesearchaeota archaeon]|nr:glycosyltransferase family 4 protein [Candidatus Woesearchaeota archaeon]